MLAEMGIWILLGIVGLAGILIGVLLALWLRRIPEAKQMKQQLEELRQRVDETHKNLPEIREGIVRVSDGLQSLIAFAQQTLHPQVTVQLRDAQSRLDQSLEAIRSVQEKLSDQSIIDEQRHGRMLTELQEAQKILTGVRSLLDQITNRVQIVATMEKAVERIETRIGDLTAMLLGRRSGQVGEGMVETLLSPVPDDWLERDVSMGKGKVEFALKMPGGYLVPLDSKFVASEIASRLAPDNGGDERQIKQIKETVKTRAKEIAERYLVDERSIGFGIAAVPDAVYEVCKGAIQASAQRHQIVIVPYSLLLPYTLSLYLMAQRLGIAKMTEKERAMSTARTALHQAKTHLENMTREITSVANLREKALMQVEAALNHLASSTTNEQIDLPA